MREFEKNETIDLSDSTKLLVLPEVPGYRIVKSIGKGANALVFKGIDKKSNRKVAIKVLKPSLQQDNDSLLRFRRELHVASGLSHPYIIKIFDVGKTGKHCIIMEYLKYSLKNLRDKKGGKLPKKEALNIIRRLAKALEYAHSKGVVHRDIKPANILFRRSGVPVLADFGLVRNLNSQSDVTKPYAIMGTPPYMSPEQCRAEKVDNLSDIYNLGVVLFEMLSGKLPYNGKNWADLFRQHIDPSVPIPLLPPYAADCQPLIDAMMAKDKNMRIDAKQVRLMIEDILSKRGGRYGRRYINRHSFLLYLMAGLIVALLIVLILILILM